MDLRELPQRFNEFKNNVTKVSIYRSLIQKQISDQLAEIQQYEYEAELYQKSSEIFKFWLETLLKNNIDSVSDLVTNGLQHVIFDQDLQFKIKQELKFNRLSMNFLIEENGIEGDPIDSFGGGAVLIASFILRLAVMARLKMANLLLLDESMFAVANKYVPFAAEFMKQISEKVGVHILMVTHNDEFMANSHIAYEAYTSSDTSSDDLKVLHLRKKPTTEV